MALDTRNKRGSAIGIMLPSRVVYPNPSGSLATVAFREQMAYSYAGIAPDSVTLTADGRYGVLVDMGSRTANAVDLGSSTAILIDLGSRSVIGRAPN
jgi:hypothetical protein